MKKHQQQKRLSPLKTIRYQVTVFSRESIFSGEVKILIYLNESKLRIVKSSGWELIQKHLLDALGGQPSQLTWTINHTWDVYYLFNDAKLSNNYFAG